MPNSNRWKPFIDGKRECTQCHIIKTQKEFTYNTTNNCYHGACKECENNGRRARTKENALVQGREFRDLSVKTCIKCHVEHPRTPEFFSQKGGSYSKVCNNCMSVLKEEHKLTEVMGVQWGPERSLVRRLYTQYRSFDEKRNLHFCLTEDCIKNALHSPCQYCGFPSTGLDRLNNDEGHTDKNCIPCCYECNTARMNNFSHEEMKILGLAIKQIKEIREGK
jgi:hypothetical protein